MAGVGLLASDGLLGSMHFDGRLHFRREHVAALAEVGWPYPAEESDDAVAVSA